MHEPLLYVQHHPAGQLLKSVELFEICTGATGIRIWPQVLLKHQYQKLFNKGEQTSISLDYGTNFPFTLTVNLILRHSVILIQLFWYDLDDYERRQIENPGD